MEIVGIEDLRQDRTAAVFVGRDHGVNVSFFVISCRRGEGPDLRRLTSHDPVSPVASLVDARPPERRLADPGLAFEQQDASVGV